MMKRLTATVHGRVQGVYFREFTRREAEKWGLVGWVANQKDGTVLVIAEGSEESLEGLLAFLHQGSPESQVTKVVADWGVAEQTFTAFQVRWL